jgi:multiple sugar transport system ATP-binding protein
VLQQLDSPQRLYDEPANLFVASFIGSPAMNLVEAVVHRRGGALVCAVGGQELAVPPEVAAGRPALAGYDGREVALGIRPERLEHAALVPDTPPDRRLRGTARLTEALGSALLAHVEIDAPPVAHEEVLEGAADEVVIEEIRAGERERRTTLVCSFDPGASVRAGEEVEIAVDTRRLHFFDLETGEAIV